MKHFIKNIFLRLGILPTIELIRFKLHQFNRRKINSSFKKAHSEVALPPDFFLYETFDLNYDKYYNGGKETAQWVLNYINDFTQLKEKNILDWGCGPGRIVRHLPTIADSSNQIFGSDYNESYIKWCSENLHHVTFKENRLQPPLKFQSSFMDVIYNISIFTHLSEKMHRAWMQELNRVLKIGGVVFTTTHGNNFISKLNTREKELYVSGNLVERRYKVEGNRLFAAYQPPSYFNKLITDAGFELLKHDERKSSEKKQKQDIWVFKKIKNIH
ncbi:MAG: class I SAM-dependent methyltransferase [Flavobacteriaceae bacterium]